MEELKSQLDALSLRVSGLQGQLDEQIRSHTHEGAMSQQIEVEDIAGTLITVTTAAELTQRLAGVPSSLTQQMFVDVSTATKKLYIWSVNSTDVAPATPAWYSVTIA